MSTTVSWQCLSCAGKPIFDQLEFMQHLREVHKIDPGSKGTQTPYMFLDGRGFHKQSYDVKIKGLSFIKSITMTKGD